MGFTQSFKMALKQLVSNKMRTALTMLGIIIGVSSVTLLISIAEGMQQSLNDQMGGLGSNLVTVNIKSRVETLSLDNSEELKNIEGVEDISQVTNGNVSLRYNNEEKDTNIIATTEMYDKIQNIELNNGRFILPIDVEYSSKIVILGSEIASELFNDISPVGNYIKISGIPYKVVGVLEEQGGGAMNSSDSNVFVPITSGQRLLKNNSVGSVYIKVKENYDINEVVTNAENKLDKIFKDSDSYGIFNQQQILDTISSMQDTMKIVLGAISSISLVVGGIGIMNIMLVSVTERTKEIGIRKALGAKRKTILIQFLIESIVVSLLGGIIGAIIGILGSNIAFSVMGVSASVSVSVVAMALGFSIIVGVVFGIMPANKASKLQPIQALRTE